MTHRPPPIPPPVVPRGELYGDAVSRIARYDPPTPINKAAVAELFQSSEEEWRALNVGHFEHSCIAPLPMLPRHFWPPYAKNLTGRAFGRMVVVGLMLAKRDQKDKRNNNPKWCCRCACGCFEARRAKAIQNPRNVIDRCFECRKLDRIRGAALHAETGEYTCGGCGVIYSGGKCKDCGEVA